MVPSRRQPVDVLGHVPWGLGKEGELVDAARKNVEVGTRRLVVANESRHGRQPSC
jgi:hypothetical protein